MSSLLKTVLLDTMCGFFLIFPCLKENFIGEPSFYGKFSVLVALKKQELVKFWFCQ